uniref:Carbohydrate kinase PfkB domain-containing protein n=1 Tax=Davidia involucrata TaxID=16924 RepID=A0A5B6ZLZ7_DAVIN
MKWSEVLANGRLGSAVVIAVARLGGRAAFIGKLGDDKFGHMLVEILKENDVNSDRIIFYHGARTALVFVMLRADGECEFSFYWKPSADMLLTPDQLARFFSALYKAVSSASSSSSSAS